MIPFDDVRATIFDAVGALAPVETTLDDALGLVTAAEIHAGEPVPPFVNSAMDGYAVRAVDTAGGTADDPVPLKVVGELPAGRAPSTSVGAGEAIRIMTGAPLPDGADAVVIVERTEAEDDTVLVFTEARVGDHVRTIGGDVEAGDIVLPTGTLLGPAHLGVLASLGIRSFPAFPRARVGVLSTGDELVEPTTPGPLPPGRIRDANRPMLLGLAERAGCVPVDLGAVGDDEDAIAERVDAAMGTCDALLTSGGVSVGVYDHVKAVLDRLGAMSWWQVAIKPAKPLAFGMIRDRPVFGLPGNPVSSLVSFELFARPALLLMMGHRDRFRTEIEAVAGTDLTRRPDGKIHFDRVRVRRDGDRYVAARSGGQASNVLTATASANGLAILPDGDGVPKGAPLRVLLLSDG